MFFLGFLDFVYLYFSHFSPKRTKPFITSFFKKSQNIYIIFHFLYMICNGELRETAGETKFPRILVNFTTFFSVLRTMAAPESMVSKRNLSSEAAAQFKTLKIIEEKPFVYNVQMNREKKLNALNTEMWR